MRTSKTINGVTTDYYWVDNVLTAQVCGDNVMLFRYDEEGNPFSFNYNGTEYFYVLNTQGDVSALMDASGITVVFYYYDAWGNITSIVDYNNTAITSASHIAHINPIRYRGYYYDSEIEMYYLQSRYYSPELCRFISCDEVLFLGANGTVLGYNLFSYCENNAVNAVDPTGHIAANVVGAAIGAIIGIIGGIFLGNWLADVLNFKGWKRGIFVASVTALVGAAAGAIGYFIGPYIAKIATQLGQYVLELLKKGKLVFQKLSNSVKTSVRALGKCACFIAGTPVLTEKGLIPIEQISSGDRVWSENPNSGDSGYKKVVKTFVNQVDTLVKLNFVEDEIITTVNHPFWVVGSGWKSASELQLGDKVKQADGTFVDVLTIEIIYLDMPVLVYNFEVEDWHTYFVGDKGIYVHNMCAKEFIKSPKNAKQVVKYLKEQGFKVVSQNGSHMKLSDGLKTTIVPNHGSKDIAIGTLKSIMKQAGLL